MPRWLYGLLALVPAAFIARMLGAPELLTFAMAAGAIAPLAGLMGSATEDLAERLGPRFGGLLNATFGNATELIITLFAIHHGLLTLVKASITGSIISNTLFVLGLSFLAGGLKHGVQRFNAQHASTDSALMILAIAGLYLPAVFAASVPKSELVEELSVMVAGVLLLIYAIFLVYTFKHRPGEHSPVDPEEREDRTVPHPADGPSIRRALLLLAAATVGAAVTSEILVDSTDTVVKELGLSEFFVGVIFVAVVGNAAEQFIAVRSAWQNRLDASLAISAGASTQVALFVAPLLIFVSIPLGHPMDLIFTPLELVILGLATAIFAYINVDGESNWFEGVQLIGIYLIAAAAFFLVPNVHP